MAPITRLRVIGAPWLKRADRPMSGVGGTTAAMMGTVIASTIGTQDRDSTRGIFYEPPPGVSNLPDQSSQVFGSQQVQVNERSLRLLATQLAAIPDGATKTKGIQIGAAEAAKILAARANDGSATAEAPYTPGSNPGDYQFTPPFDAPPFNGYAAAPKWGEVTPFGLKRGDQFRAPPPYKVKDLAYTFDYNEVKAHGAVGSLVRTSDQTNLALFWYENSTFGWNRMARLIAAQHSLTLFEHAQLFASLNVAVFDAYVASFDSKYTHKVWRPITAIRAAGTDGNDATVADASWDTLFLTPPIPDYPSGHACAGGAASAVLISVFGDEQTFTLPSTMSAQFPQIQARTFHRISDAAKENAFSRMLVGIHFRLACEVGLAQGIDVGTWIVQHEALTKAQ
jgi:hypothetical protein